MDFIFEMCVLDINWLSQNKLDRVEMIMSHTTSKKYTVRQKVDCKSNLLYFSTCTKCGQQYVGDTKSGANK